MKEVVYKITKSMYLNQNWFDTGDTIHLKEINMVVNGASCMRFTDKNGYYYSLKAKKFNQLFKLIGVNYLGETNETANRGKND